MQQNRPQSSAPRRPAAPRPVVIQTLEGRQLMSASVVIETSFPFPAAFAVEEVDYGSAPTHQAFGFDPGFADGGGFWHGPAGFQPPMASSPVTTVAVPVAATGATPVTTSAVASVPADATTSLPLVDASAGPVAAPAVAVPAPQRDLLAATDGNDDGSMAAPAPAAVASLVGPANPAAFTTGGIAVAAVTSGSGPSAVMTAAGDIVPTAVTTIARTPFATVVDAAPVVPAAAVTAPDAATGPASSMSLLPVAGRAFTVPAGAPVAAPSFGETVIESARASHPLALAVAAGAAVAVWMSTESARDRRREQLSQSVADAAAIGDDRLIAMGLFRG